MANRCLSAGEPGRFRPLVDEELADAVWDAWDAGLIPVDVAARQGYWQRVTGFVIRRPTGVYVIGLAVAWIIRGFRNQ